MRDYRSPGRRPRRRGLAVGAVAAGLVLAVPASWAAAGAALSDINSGSVEMRPAKAMAEKLADGKVTYSPATKAARGADKAAGPTRFDVTRGRLDPRMTAGRFEATGGFTLEAAKGHKVTFSGLKTDLGKSSTTAVMDGKKTGKRIPLFSYDAKDFKIKPSLKSLQVEAIKLRLTKDAADALNKQLGTSLKPGEEFADATGKANLL